jgi:DNA-binding response OmpR family regulator/signal transduction histidine kinase/ligand-binding sensor domain-containing protein
MQLFVFYKKLLLIIGIFLFLYSSFSTAQERYLHFTEIDGLPRNITTCLAQDQYGYLWVGTSNGIARFDGKNFYCYKELNSIGVIRLYYSNKTNILWAATSKGLFKYNRLTNFFENKAVGFITKVQEDNDAIYFLMVSNIFKLENDTPKIIYTGNNISDFCITNQGIWITTSDNGVTLLSRKSNFTQVEFSLLKNISAAIITPIDDKVFVGCFNGQLYSINQQKKLELIISNNHYFVGKISKVGNEIWQATDGNGIIVLDKNFHFLRTMKKNLNTEASINSNSIQDILPGNNNEIWIATYGAGLTCILPDNLLFQNILPEKGNENSLIANEAVSVFVKNPYFYFGTNYGLSVWNETTGKFKHLPNDKLYKDLNGSKVTALTVDRNNILWVGTYDGLLGKYTADFRLLKTYSPSSNTSNQMQQIVSLREVGKNNLLIATQFYSRILLNFDMEKGTTDVFELYSKGSNITYCILNSLRENQNGELLAILSDKGLFHVNWKDNVIENRLSEMNKNLNAYITDFYQDKKGNYWFTSSSGLLHISVDGKNYVKYTVKEGLPTNVLLKMESVDDRFLWISSVSGICRFDMQTGQVLNFNHNDGLPANEFFEGVIAQTLDKRIIFGSLAGFTIINPKKINLNATKTKVIISDIAFQNQSIRNQSGEQFLTQPLEETKELWLPFHKNSFSIHFFAKNESFLKYHNYSYRLKGLEKDWTYVIETNYANYTNLNPGTYIFEVKTVDKTSKAIITQLIIHIRSPWYLSWFAYVIYSIIFFTILILSVYAWIKRLELRNEKVISEFKIQKEHELTEKKLEFFTNISHDLKTPLTLIDSPVNDLLQSENLSKEQVNKLSIINRNSKRLYKLISDLLDFRKITQKQYVLEVKETIISDILTGISEAFKEECKNKTIDLECSVEQNLTGFVDARKIEKILWNLLSNALKFTKKEGKIMLIAEELLIDGIKYIKLIVSDTGIGISENDKNKIFERFYKVKDSQLFNVEGTGIGLAIVKELAEIHHGKIQVESVLGSGTTFTIILPSSKECFSTEELVVPEYLNYQTPGNENLEITIPQDIVKQYNQQGVLIVEDNNELRDYLAGHFEKRLKVYLAEDGLVGLNLAKEVYPDVIITDVQMPTMNGYEFCRELRRNFDTSHIPVIMLTANTTIENQIEGLSTGADVYLTKPFNIKILDAHVYSLLENRKTLRHKFLKVETTENLEKALPQKDIDFILELKLFIKENIMNPDLKVELLSKHFSVSLAQLHRKIKSLTDTTPNNLIKSIRLKKAYLLIREGGLRVSEAAYQTGFSDPNYFTTCFKKEFGENPSQIAPDIKDSTITPLIELSKFEVTASASTQTNSENNQNNEQLPLLLIADDNDEMRRFLKDEFTPKYRIIEAADGNTALGHAVSEIPDIIVSDIMMPGIDGIELCRLLKTDERTSHIPIVLLTAKNTDENMLEGLENGADDYVSKPFNISILKARVRNLYQSRLMLRNRFMNEPEATVKEISPSASDERFLKKAYDIVEKHLSKPDFDVQVFSSELGMSRAQLYRKIDGISGQSVNEFIRIVRLKKAAGLLLNSDFQISEIAENVGFNSFAYFTKSFKEFFGVTPTQYKNK